VGGGVRGSVHWRQFIEIADPLRACGRSDTNGSKLQDKERPLSSRDYAEKRGFIRMAVDCKASYRLDGEEQEGEGVLRDLSGSGMALETDREVPAGSVLRIRVHPEQALVPPLEAQVEVVRVDDAGSGRCRLGLTILEIAR
jgi:hypothetical protein